MRLIDADALKKKLKDEPFFGGITLYDVCSVIDDTPSTDAVEIVRCRDCKHLFSDSGCPLRTFRTHVEDDYCSYGERK